MKLICKEVNLTKYTGILLKTYNQIFNKNIGSLDELHRELEHLKHKQYKQLFKIAA